MIELVPISPADFSKLISWAASEEFLMQWTGRTFKFPLNLSQLEEYYSLSLGNSPKRIILKAVDDENGKHIGNITIDWARALKNEAALTCIIIGSKDYLGKGIGELIVREACKIAFEKLNKKKVFLNVFEFNKGAIKCYEKCGFEQVSKESIIVNGNEYTNIRMEIIPKK